MEHACKTRPTQGLAGAGAGVLERVLDVIAVGRDWLGPHLSAGLMVGGGLALTGAGLAWKSTVASIAGIGLAAGGVYALLTQAAIDVYEAIDKLEIEDDELHSDEPDAEAERINDDQDDQLDADDDPPLSQSEADARAHRSLRNSAKRARKARKANRRKRTARRERQAPHGEPVPDNR